MSPGSASIRQNTNEEPRVARICHTHQVLSYTLTYPTLRFDVDFERRVVEHSHDEATVVSREVITHFDQLLSYRYL